MYEQHYGLRERPFNLTPSPRFLFLSRRHREALAHVRYALTGRPGITMLVGEAGTGKTTIVRSALAGIDRGSATVVHLSNPTLTRSEFFEYLAAGFNFPEEAATSKTRFLHALEQALRADAPSVLALVVDEAQSLSYELLEELRLLTNSCSASERAITLILVGQPELADRLNEGPLRQLRQRIALRCELRAFDLKETAAYVASRVRIAGGQAEALFTRDAIVAVHERSAGIPRNISVICDNALVTGFAADVRPVGRDIILEVCRDFDFEPTEPIARPPRAPAAGNRGVPGSANGTRGANGNGAGSSNGNAAGSANGNGNSSARAADPRAEAPAVGRTSVLKADPRPMFSGFSRPRRFSFF